MTMFAYNNSIYFNIEKISHKLLKKYTANFAETFENKVQRKKAFLIIKRA